MKKIKPCVIGLGYIGLPIFIRLSKIYDTCGYDINISRINDLKKKKDNNLEFKSKDFYNNTKSKITNNKSYLKDCNFFIITVPSPMHKNKKPNLKFIEKAIIDISEIIKKNDIIVLESTVYPGVTEEFCGNILKKNKRNLKINKDFFLAYSPERINPGDKKHTINKIKKILAINNNIIKKKILKVYKNLSKNIVFSNKIKETETAKIIENIQRDVNIAFINEVFMFCKKNNLDFNEVIRLAKTKWNFLNFKPGLVGGHCLPVNPYYFAEAAKRVNFKTKLAIAGRNVNQEMANYIANLIKQDIEKRKLKKIRVLIAGLTYKPNVPDIRNALPLIIFKKLKLIYKNIDCYDPIINKSSLKKYEYISNKINIKKYDIIYILTNHKIFKNIFQNYNNKIFNVFSDL